MKDRCYNAIKSLIETHKIESLQEIFAIIPITVVKSNLKVDYNTLRKRINQSELLTLKDIIQLSNLFEVEPVEVFKLTVFDYNKRHKVAKKKS